jgi:hypothetical protein
MCVITFLPCMSDMPVSLHTVPFTVAYTTPFECIVLLLAGCIQALSRHASSLDLLSLYVKFLQGVRNDPWGAAHWQAEVEKLQRQEEELNQR